MKRYANKSLLVIVLILLTVVTSCSKMDEYKDFTKDGEISYTGKIDSVRVLTGEGKVIITGLFMSDPKVVKCRVYWNSKQDSVDIPVNKTAGVDKLYHPITLPEGFYNFEIYTYDKEGNRSITVYANGKSYGDIYKASISNRYPKSALLGYDDTTRIEWSNIDLTLGAFQTVLTYTGNDGTTKTYTAKTSEKQSKLSDYKVGTKIYFDTWFLPDTLCVDTFRTAQASTDVIAKIKKTAWTITTDSEETAREGSNGFATCAIDNNINTFWHTRHPGNGDTPFPHFLQIDMHQTIDVKSFELTPRQGNDQGITDFEIHGSMDGVTWNKYGPFKLDPVTNDTQMFTLIGALPMRYFKFYATNGRNGSYTHLAEISIFGVPQ